MQIEIPGYEVKDRIADGGMASVYLARQLNFDQDVALKIMKSALSREPDFVKRFMKEARIMRKLRHRNLCEVFDVNAHGELHYIAMELLPGGTLAQLTRRGITPEFASNLLLQLLEALDYAHRQGFIHRDIKPANILMRDSSTPVLTDFGIARAADAATHLTMTGTMLGTPYYMSPEQANSGEVDGRADLYSLGIVFYEMLTGAVPYRADSPVATCIQHITQPIPTLPAPLQHFQDFINQALAKTAPERFADAAAMANCLAGVIGKMPTTPEAKTVVTGPLGNSGIASRVSLNGLAPAPVATHDQNAPGPVPATGSQRPPVTAPVETGDGKSRVGRFALWGVAFTLSAALIVVLGRVLLREEMPVDKVEAPPISSAQPLVDGFVQEARQAIADDRYTDAEAGFRSALAFDVANKPALDGLRELGDIYFELSQKALAADDIALANSMVANLVRVNSNAEGLGDLQSRIRQRQYEIEGEQSQKLAMQQRQQELLATADAALASKQLYNIDGSGALQLYRSVLEIDAGNRGALAGLQQVAGIFLEQAERSIAQNDIPVATTALGRAREAAPDDPRLATVGAALSQLEASSREYEAQARLLSEQRAAEVAALLASAEQKLQVKNYFGADGAYQDYRQALNLEPGNARAQAGIEQVAAALAELADGALGAADYPAAQSYIKQMAAFDGGSERLSGLQKRYRDATYLQQRELEREQRIASLLASAQEDFGADRLYASYQRYQQVLQSDASNTDAVAGIAAIADRYMQLTEQAVRDGESEKAKRYIGRMVEVDPDYPQLASLQRRVEDMKPQVSTEQQVVAKLRAEANTLAARPVSVAILQQQLGLYEDIRATLPSDPQVGGELRRLGDRAVVQVERLLEQEVPDPAALEQANAYIAFLTGSGLAKSELGALKSLYQERMQASQQQTAQKSGAARKQNRLDSVYPALTATLARNELNYQQLDGVLQSMLGVRDIRDPRVDELAGKMKQRYLDFIDQRVEGKQYKEALAAADDALAYFPADPDILESQKNAKKQMVKVTRAAPRMF